MLEILTDEERARCEDIRRTFRQNLKLKGVAPDDKIGLVIAQLSTFADGLDSIRRSVSDGVTQLSDNDDRGQQMAEAVARMEALGSGVQSLSDRLNEGLTQIARLADRPIQIDVPPIDVQWPETMPALTATPPPNRPRPLQCSRPRNRPSPIASRSSTGCPGPYSMSWSSSSN